jgi:hypothetical protein
MKSYVVEYYKGSQRLLRFVAATAWACVLFRLLVARAVAPSCGFQSSSILEGDKILRLASLYERRRSIQDVSLRYTLSRLYMGFFDGFSTRIFPRRNFDSTDIVYWMSDGAMGSKRRFFDPPVPLIHPKNDTPEISGEILNKDCLPPPQPQEVEPARWTAEDKKAFLTAALQSRNVLLPSHQSSVCQFDDHNSNALLANMERHQKIPLSPSTVDETDEWLEKVHEDKEREKYAWVEMVLDPNRYHRIRSTSKSSFESVSPWTRSTSRSLAMEAERETEIVSRYSQINCKIDIKSTNSELDNRNTASLYLSNREAINRMLKQRSSHLNDDKVAAIVKSHESLDDSAVSDEDIQKTRSVIRQFHSSIKSDSETVGSLTSMVQSSSTMQSPGFALPQNMESRKQLKKKSKRVPPNTIRMKLPIPDDGDEDDGIDAQAYPNLSLRDAMQKISNKASSESQVDRSKKWGIDISKFT